MLKIVIILYLKLLINVSKNLLIIKKIVRLVKLEKKDV